MRLSISISFVRLLFLLLLASACSSPSPTHYTQLIPDQAAIIWHGEGQKLEDYLKSEPAKVWNLLGGFPDAELAKAVTLTYLPHRLQAVASLPRDSEHQSLLYLLQADEALAKTLFENNLPKEGIKSYQHKSIPIFRFQLTKRVFFATSIAQYTLISESSLGIEQAIAQFLAKNADAAPSSPPKGQGFELHLSQLEQLIAQNLNVGLRPTLENATTAFSNAWLRALNPDSLAAKYAFALNTQTQAPLSHPFALSIAYENAPFELDEYISADAAHFSIFRNSPNQIPASLQLQPSDTKLDSALLLNDVLRSNLLESLDIAFGTVTFVDSGFNEEGEFLWLRKLKDANALRTQLERLRSSGLIKKEDNVYSVQSRILANLLTNGLYESPAFFIGINYEALVVAERIGLIQGVGSDRSRRRTIRYNSKWESVRKEWPKTFSSLHVAESPKLQRFMEPFLRAGNYIEILFDQFSKASLYTQMQSNQSDATLKIQFSAYQDTETYRPFEENWVFPLYDEALVGPIVAENLVGSSRPEVIFATNAGKVYVLASDGTLVREMQTQEEDKIIGSPLVVDWYRNGLNCIILAAGDKIYGWDNQGNTLPRFPIQLPDAISSPIQIDDFRQNGSLEILVATQDRKLHILDAKGEAVRGWPVTLNTNTALAPHYARWNGKAHFFIPAQNVLHAYGISGIEHEGFPIFLESEAASPVTVGPEHIFIGDESGAVHAIGKKAFFSSNYLDAETTIDQEANPPYIRSKLSFGATAIAGKIALTKEAIKPTENAPATSDERILYQSFSGQIYLIDKSGQRLRSFELGEFTSADFSPLVSPLYANSKEAVVMALSSYGRLQAWYLDSQKRVIGLPGTAMQFPFIADLNRDGIMELIANAPDGIRSWNLIEP